MTRGHVILIWLGIFVALYGVVTLQHRVEALEKQCHAQCQMGDSECDRRCSKQNFCPFALK